MKSFFFVFIAVAVCLLVACDVPLGDPGETEENHSPVIHSDSSVPDEPESSDLLQNPPAESNVPKLPPSCANESDTPTEPAPTEPAPTEPAPTEPDFPELPLPPLPPAIPDFPELPPVVPVSVEVICQPFRMQYRTGEAPDLTGCSLGLRMSDDSLVPVDISCFTAVCDTSTAGIALLEFSAQEGSVTVPLLICDHGEVISLDGGPYIRGSDTDTSTDNSAFPITVKSFAISLHETTYELWSAVRDWAELHSAESWEWTNRGKEGNAGIVGAPCSANSLEPVTYINWVDAAIWCNARSEWAGIQPVYYCDSDCTEVLRSSALDGTVYVKQCASGWRLPTEAEWEYAAGVGLDGPQSPRMFYPGTDSKTELPLFAWIPSSCKAAGKSGTWPVGSLPSTGSGLYDMAGNVAEWCQDWYDASWYSLCDSTDSGGPAFSPELARVIRGSSYNGTILDCETANRSSKKYSGKSGSIGFRSVRTIPL